MNLPQMDGMTICAVVCIRTSAAGESAQVIFALIVLEEYICKTAAHPTTDVGLSTTALKNTDEEKDPGTGKNNLP